MDKPKQNQVRLRVMDILRNHSQEMRVIEAQIAAEKESLEADLEEILLQKAYPSTSLNPSGIRSPSLTPDDKLVQIVEKRDRRKQQAESRIADLKKQLAQIEEVKSIIYQLDTRSKCVLLALYYPYRSYNAAAEFLQTERTTIYRQRKIALERLFTRVEKSFWFGN